jgi:hypothetical protein
MEDKLGIPTLLIDHGVLATLDLLSACDLPQFAIFVLNLRLGDSFEPAGRALA